MLRASSAAIERLPAPPEGRDLADLAEVLVASVDAGASVGFLPPMDRAEAEAFWRGVAGEQVVLLGWRDGDGRLAGTVQLRLVAWPNAPHRAEVAKLLVHPRARRQGIGRALMEALERQARDLGRTLLVLDTREGDPSNALYRSMGYVEVGRIPRYVISERGGFDATVVYYRDL